MDPGIYFMHANTNSKNTRLIVSVNYVVLVF